jgi:hypothetical protein
MALGSISTVYDEVASAIKQPAYDNLILELNDYVDKIELILRDTEMKIHDTNEYFKGEVGDSVREKFDKYFRQIDMMTKNLLTYSNDLIKIKEGLAAEDKALNTMLTDFATGLKAEAEIVNEQ